MTYDEAVRVLKSYNGVFTEENGVATLKSNNHLKTFYVGGEVDFDGKEPCTAEVETNSSGKVCFSCSEKSCEILGGLLTPEPTEEYMIKELERFGFIEKKVPKIVYEQMSLFGESL